MEKELLATVRESEMSAHLHAPNYIKSTGYCTRSSEPDLAANPFKEYFNSEQMYLICVSTSGRINKQ